MPRGKVNANLDPEHIESIVADAEEVWFEEVHSNIKRPRFGRRKFALRFHKSNSIESDAVRFDTYLRVAISRHWEGGFIEVVPGAVPKLSALLALRPGGINYLGTGLALRPGGVNYLGTGLALRPAANVSDVTTS